MQTSRQGCCPAIEHLASTHGVPSSVLAKHTQGQGWGGVAGFHPRSLKNMHGPRLHSLAVPNLLSPLLEHEFHGPWAPPSHHRECWKSLHVAVRELWTHPPAPLLRALPMASMIHDVQYEEAEGTWVGGAQ